MFKKLIFWTPRISVIVALVALSACKHDNRPLTVTAVADAAAVADTCALANMAAAGHYEMYDWNVTAAHFPVNPGAFSTDGIKIFRFDQVVTTQQVEATIRASGLVSARIERLFAYGAASPDVVAQSGAVVALGSIWDDPDGVFHWAPALQGNGGKNVQVLSVTPDTKWETYYWFLAAKPGAAGGTAPDAPAACALAKMVEVGHFDTVDPHISATRFTVDQSKFTVQDTRLTLDDIANDDMAEPVYRADGNMSAGLEKLLAFGAAKGGKRTQDFVTVANGASWLDEQGVRTYACLSGNEITGCQTHGWTRDSTIGTEKKPTESLHVQYLIVPNPHGSTQRPTPTKADDRIAQDLTKEGVPVPEWLVNPGKMESASYGIDEVAAVGNMWGDEIGDAFGSDSAPSSEGIGLGNIGRMGHPTAKAENKPSWQSLIDGAHFAWVHPEITAQLFPLPNGYVGVTGTKDFRFTMRINAADVKQAMTQEGYKPVSFPQLVSFAAKRWNPAVDDERAVVALGSSWVDSNGLRNYPCVEAHDGKRSLAARWGYGPNDEFGEEAIFLGIKK